LNAPPPEGLTDGAENPVKEPALAGGMLPKREGAGIILLNEDVSLNKGVEGAPKVGVGAEPPNGIEDDDGANGKDCEEDAEEPANDGASKVPKTPEEDTPNVDVVVVVPNVDIVEDFMAGDELPNKEVDSVDEVWEIAGVDDPLIEGVDKTLNEAVDAD